MITEAPRKQPGPLSRARIPNALVRIGVGSPWRTIAFWLLVGVVVLPGVAQLRIDTSTDSVLDRAHPAWQRYLESQAQFGGDEIIVVALRGDSAFDPDRLKQVIELSSVFERVPGVRRVDSLATVPAVWVDSSGALELIAPLESAPLGDAELVAHVAKKTRRDLIAPRNLVSGDERVFAINLVLDRGLEDRHADMLNEIHAIADPAGAILSGVPVFRVAANEMTGSEILFFAPITILVLGVILVVVFRSPIALLAGTAPGAIGSWVLVGAMGFTGSPLSITTMVLPSIMLALGCAYAMHFLSAASRVRAEEALEVGLCRIALPVALSGLTTAVGLVSITVVRIEAVRATGAYGALGVLAVTAASLTIVPAILALRRSQPREPLGFAWLSGSLSSRLVEATARHSTLILILWALFSGVVGLGISQLSIETDATRWLPPGNPVRDDYESIRAALSGISPVNLVIRAPEGRTVLEDTCLEAINDLSNHLEALPDVGRAVSIAHPLRQMHGGFSEDPSLPLPSSEALAEQYMLLLESTHGLSDLISIDHRSANIKLRVDDNASASLMSVADAAEAWWAAHGPADYELVPTGIMYEFARAEDEIAYGQLRGLSVAMVVISLILFAIFRSPRLALVALVPNALPLLVMFGAMGLLGIPMDAGTALIGGLALGIAVDDTIHIATGYSERIEAGLTPRDALLGVYSIALPPIICTTFAIACAFSLLGVSEFTITRDLGLVTATIMLLCLVADVTLLAALLIRLPARR